MPAGTKTALAPIGRFQMLFLEKGHACAFRTTFVVEGELGCMVDGREPLRLPLGEGPPIPRAKELKTTSPINAIARANARRRLLDATRSVGRMRAALCRGIWVTGEKRITMFLLLHLVPVRKGEPRCVPEFRNGSMDLKLTVSERSLASICTRRCTAQSVVAKFWFRRRKPLFRMRGRAELGSEG